MLVVKKIVNFIFPVVDLPEDKAIRKGLKEYFDKMEEEKFNKFKVIIVLGLLVMIINFYIFTKENIVIIDKIVLLVPQSILFLKGTYLMCRYKYEKNDLKAIILKDNFVILFILSLLIAAGNGVLSNVDTGKTNRISDSSFFYLVIAMQIYYFTSYLIGYHMYYKKVVENLWKDSKEKKTTANQGIGYTVIGSLLVYSTRRFNLISGNALCLILCGLTGFGLYKLAAIKASSKFYCKLYEK